MPATEILGRKKLEVTKIKNGYEIKYGAMYEAPSLNFDTLMKLSEHFGTREIDVDGYANSGCESCDYGSDYGHEIQILNPTQNVKELEDAVHADRALW